jgi:hypothetical protein
MFKYEINQKVKASVSGKLIPGVIIARYVYVCFNIYVILVDENFTVSNKDVTSNLTHLPFYEWALQPVSNMVVLNDNYSAEVHKDKVVVGCQTFPIDKLKEIIKISENL